MACSAQSSETVQILQFGGVNGAFNCQGAGWDPVEHRVQGYSRCYKLVSGNVQPADVEWGQREDTSAMVKAASYAVYRCQTEEFLLMTPGSEPIQFTLQPSSFELFTFAPVTTSVVPPKHALRRSGWLTC